MPRLDENARGVFPISATPFTDNGAIDWESADRLTDFYLQCGVHGMTLLGMMGEAQKLTLDEASVIRACAPSAAWTAACRWWSA